MSQDKAIAREINRAATRAVRARRTFRGGVVESVDAGGNVSLKVQDYGTPVRNVSTGQVKAKEGQRLSYVVLDGNQATAQALGLAPYIEGDLTIVIINVPH